MKTKGKVIITITEQKGKNTEFTCKCLPVFAFEIIKKIAKDNEIEVYVNSVKMSMASIIALKGSDFEPWKLKQNKNPASLSKLNFI